ncbi:DUF1758 domain-containing protein [Trichonephila clavipes]|nr:DUF1758 domain-containing protein [Trichonephila clavipes]
MSLPNPVEQKSHDVINNKLSRVMKEVAEESMKMAAVEEYSSSPDNLLTVSGDGTWKTRGHSSLIGVCTVIGAETGDGDTKTFNALSENKPYGDDYFIQKIECVGHVQKRMGTRLRKLILVYSKKKLSDGKTIGGKGRLTDSLIDKLAHYYGNAIRCNSTSVKEMRKAIWAVWGHSCSTDDEPMHWFCPTNPNTWCKYNAAINNNLQNYKHKPSVAKAVRDVIKPVFADLSHPALLKKCLGRIPSSASGSIPVSSENKPHCGLIKDNVDLEKTMRRFSEIENVEPETIKNKKTIIYSSEIKVLGVYWNPKHDCFSFRVKIDLYELNTKRDVLSTIARIYDPLGLLGPVVAKAKIFLQKLWMLKIDWTDLLPDTFNREWRQFVESLQVVNDININRCIVVEQPELIELHGFSNASQSAYVAVVYCKSITSDRKMLVHLIASKSRVAPTKQTTIPRLELCAAVLLAKLVHRVKQALKLNVTNTFLWSDSMIVLSWITKESYQLKTFVANRIATIQEMTSSEQWRYVATEDNPVDFVSRGMDSLKLKTCELWWKGPKFSDEQPVPTTTNSCCSDQGSRSKKEDLRRIASELELCVSDKLTVLDFMDLIKNCDRYKNDPDSVHELANLIIEERKYDESQQLELEK